MSATSSQRKKSWHESKKLRKRAAFLLEDASLIPTDICFRIRTKNGKIKEVHGHKIFFALASPVFHAMFYGTIKEEGNVEITDVSVEAFLCLQKYIYTDSFGGVSVANMIDVLAASKKYLMAKLTRYCYGFIQNHITAENSVSLWSQAQEAFDDTVTDQCVAEIGRNTTKAISTESFLNISQDQLLELTSWQKLTSDEFDLFQAVKKYVMESKRGKLYGHFCFMFRYKNAGKELKTFNPRTRDPAPTSFQLSINYYVSNKFDKPADMEWKLFGSLRLLIWADLAPTACQLLRHYVENDFDFSVGQTLQYISGDYFCDRKKRGTSDSSTANIRLTSEEERNIESRNKLWPVAGSVLLSVEECGPVLAILNKTEQTLRGKQPSKPPENSLVYITGYAPGIVVGEVLSCPSGDLKKLHDFMYAASYEFDPQDALCFPLVFECSIVEPDS